MRSIGLGWVFLKRKRVCEWTFVLGSKVWVSRSVLIPFKVVLARASVTPGKKFI